MSLWVRSTQPGGGAGPRLVSKRDAAGPGYEVSLHGSGDLWAGQVAGATSATLAPGRTNVADGNWHLLTLVRRDLSLTAYEDGTPAAAQMSAAEDDAANALALRLGAAAGPTPVQFFAGQLDEVRVSAGARSFDWILADFNSQSSPATFVLVGAEVAP